MSGIAADQIRETNTNVDDIVKLVDVGGGVPGLPAVDGSLVTNLQGFDKIIMTVNGDVVATTVGSLVTKL